MSEVSITVPAQYAERFKSEALDTLALMAKSIEEAAEWRRKGKGDPNRLANELPQMRAAEQLFDQVQHTNGGPLHVTSDRRVIGDTLDGCALEAAEDIHGAVESRSGTEHARALMEELDEWLTMRNFQRDEGEAA